jgi:hypothetical protein
MSIHGNFLSSDRVTFTRGLEADDSGLGKSAVKNLVSCGSGRGIGVVRRGTLRTSLTMTQGFMSDGFLVELCLAVLVMAMVEHPTTTSVCPVTALVVCRPQPHVSSDSAINLLWLSYL